MEAGPSPDVEVAKEIQAECEMGPDRPQALSSPDSIEALEFYPCI